MSTEPSTTTQPAEQLPTSQLDNLCVAYISTKGREHIMLADFQNGHIKAYARDWLDMVDEDDCDCVDTSSPMDPVIDFDTVDRIATLSLAGLRDQAIAELVEAFSLYIGRPL